MGILRDKLRFKYEWREYQKNVLESLNAHLADKKINVVAAPGAGKTTLGVEIIARLDIPTLILAPTVAIRNQWKSRICEAFLEKPEECESIISLSLRAPKAITISTYQGLFAAFCGIDEGENSAASEAKSGEILDDFQPYNARFDEPKIVNAVETLRRAGIKALCLDEAHHLRNEWWKALNILCESLSPKTVSLTATPPFDVGYGEWKRYEALCGPIDACISIPELVKVGDLCPHQDFIYFAELRKAEKIAARERERVLSDFAEDVFKNAELAGKLSLAEIFQEAQARIDVVLDAPDFFLALLAYLKRFEIRPNTELYKMLGVKYHQIKSFSLSDIDALLNGLFFKERGLFGCAEAEISELKKSAEKAGLICKGKFSLLADGKIKRMCALSLGKLDAIEAIVSAQSAAFGENLRMLILADYIRAEALNSQITSFGVVPVFEMLRKRGFEGLKLGVLTGSIIILPRECAELAAESPTLKGGASVKILDFDERYAKLHLRGNARHKAVGVVTSLFESGKINVLAGTQALLGEGWDAPCINSIILSSTVKSYMLSNQMRGRAVRIDKKNPEKVATIWHLCSIRFISFTDSLMALLPKSSMSESELFESDDYLHDIRTLTRRFEGFEAPSISKPVVISSGISRILDVNKMLAKREIPPSWNSRSLAASVDLPAIRRAWEEGFKDSYDNPELALKSELAFHKIDNRLWSLANLSYILSFYFLIAAGSYIYVLQRAGIFGLAAAAGIFAYFSFRPALMWLRCGNPNKYIRQIARTVIETLYSMDIVKTRLDTVRIKSETSGDMSCLQISNLPQDETSAVINAIREIVDPIENPRYILVRRQTWKNIRQADYHAVPSIISAKRETVETFAGLWRRYVGDCDIVYTRSIEGRKLLLKAKNASYSSALKRGNARLTKRI